MKVKSRLLSLRFKRRLIVFREAYGPTISSSCVYSLSAIAFELHFGLCHFEVDETFVQPKLEADVFLHFPK